MMRNINQVWFKEKRGRDGNTFIEPRAVICPLTNLQQSIFTNEGPYHIDDWNIFEGNSKQSSCTTFFQSTI